MSKAKKASTKKDDKLKVEIETLNHKVADLEDQNLRLYAEFDNFKKLPRGRFWNFDHAQFSCAKRA